MSNSASSGSRQGGTSIAGVSICTFVLVKARKLSYLVRDRGSASLAGVSICTFVLVKARKLSYLARERGGASLALGARAGEPPEQAQRFG